MRVLIALYAGLCLAGDLATEGPAILARRCAGCHGARNKIAGLDLSSGETAKHRLERALRRVKLGEMPPNGPIPVAEQELLASWIQAGAPWQTRAPGTWWSLQPLRQVESSIDDLVAAKLTRNQLSRSPEADRRTLIRRVTFGLIGLPPTPEEIEAFVTDTRPDAYSNLVDRLLASPHYGERWARHWLDVARFTESEGFERDMMREHAWPYRDYVIRSLNQDKSYLLFAREQIAGDVMQPVTRDGIIATGFLVSGPTDAVGLTSAVEREREAVREDQLEEMVGTVSQTFLGLTANCARCHDHKFDPIPQRDYYRFKAALAGVWQPFHDPASTELFPDGRILDAASHQDRIQGLRNRIEWEERSLARIHGVTREPLNPRPAAQWNFDVDARDQVGELHASVGTKSTIGDGRLQSKSDVTLTTVPLPFDVREKTLEVWFFARQHQEKGVNLLEIANRRGYRGAANDGIRLSGGPKQQWVNVSTASFRTAEVNGPAETTVPGSRIHVAITYATDGTIRLYRNGAPYGDAYRPDAGASGLLQTYVKGDAVIRFTSTPNLELDEARLYTSALTEEQIAASYRQGAPSRLPDLSVIGPRWQQLNRLKQLVEDFSKPEKSFAAQPREPEPTHLLRRGDVNLKGEVLVPGGLSCLPGSDFDAGTATDAERRTKLAEWIANANNPLFARVIVNRIWSHHFGVGIVENPNDFGANGGAPSHEDLLDRLAGELIESGWSLKKLHRSIVLSATYRQSSAFRPAAAAKDAGNRLLWRFSPRRLEGEAVRDAMLAVSGKLNRQFGGPSFRPFTVKNPGGSYVKYEPRDSDEPDLQRRSVYRMNVNTGGDPMLESLDCPVPSVKTPKRPSTTTPLQALSLMNNPFSVRLSKAFAARVASEAAGVDARIVRAFALALGRAPGKAELESSRALVNEQNLDAFCWGLFNASEFLQLP
jgi:mono/diheme cytochrome c family protein